MRRLTPALVLLAACATARGPASPPPPQEIRFAEPAVVEATPLDLELAGKNDEELFAVGTAAIAAGDHARAAAAFDRLADLFPASGHRQAALSRSGLAHERLSQWRLALERFRALEGVSAGPEAVEASFRVAECLWHLGELAEADAVLERLAGRRDLGEVDRVRALTWRGVVELDQGRDDDAERSFRLALQAWGERGDQERLDDYFPAQAQYYLGEVYRRHFQAVALDPSRDGQERLEQALELKAELLLSAQGHYLRAVRMGNPDWAVAAGYRIGELYDELHAQLTAAASPPGLDAEAEAAYRAELSRKVRVLLTKAIAVYERTLDAAQRARVDNAFVERTQASLDRVKRALSLDGAEAAAPPPDADPARPPGAEGPGRGGP